MVKSFYPIGFLFLLSFTAFSAIKSEKSCSSYYTASGKAYSFSFNQFQRKIWNVTYYTRESSNTEINGVFDIEFGPTISRYPTETYMVETKEAVIYLSEDKQIEVDLICRYPYL